MSLLFAAIRAGGSFRIETANQFGEDLRKVYFRLWSLQKALQETAKGR